MAILIILFLFLTGCSPSWAQQDDIQQSCSALPQDKPPLVTKTFKDFAYTRTDKELCGRIQTIPIGTCPDPKMPVRHTYWEPTLVVETVRQAGDYVIRDTLGGKPRSLKEKACGGALTQSLGGSNLQFNEVHVYANPDPQRIEFEAMCQSVPNILPYYTEEHAVDWRTKTSNRRIPSMGAWGRLYPRIGFMVHTSPLVASAASVIKAVDISHPEYTLLDPPPYQWLMHDQIQMVYPQKSECMPIGTNLQSRESLYQSREGKHVWLFWHRYTCCRPY